MADSDRRERAARAVYEVVEQHEPRCDELCPPDCPGPVEWALAPQEVRDAAYRVADRVLAEIDGRFLPTV